MNVSQLTKYQKSRLTPCIYCHKPITQNQEFELLSTKDGRFIIYAFIHKDCIAESQKSLNCITDLSMEEVRDEIRV